MLIAPATKPASSSASYTVVASRERWRSFMFTIVSTTPCEKPAFRNAENDEPYSTIRFSSRFHHESDGMWWTSGPAPVAIELRHTGVSDGKTDVARRYAPCAAR